MKSIQNIATQGTDYIKEVVKAGLMETEFIKKSYWYTIKTLFDFLGRNTLLVEEVEEDDIGLGGKYKMVGFDPGSKYSDADVDMLVEEFQSIMYAKEQESEVDPYYDENGNTTSTAPTYPNNRSTSHRNPTNRRARHVSKPASSTRNKTWEPMFEPEDTTKGDAAPEWGNFNSKSSSKIWSPNR